ncbi:MAG TPA: protein-disulfide reductase DsbD domain-containing protein [Methyloceanibacter sp.]|nr:protein-disulfide reductase DsbD domain-containing protein [Methyloceanibacter sp.]
MTPVRLLASRLALTVSLALSGASLAASPGESPWVKETYSKVRLVSGSVPGMSGDHMIAGVQIRLEPGWKTYWRMPGDSGVPPSFDWSGSKNLKSAQVLYPAPHRFTDASGTAIGYEDEVVFPMIVTPERAGEPVQLKVNVDYGICKTLCIPNQADLSIELPAPAAGEGDDALLSRFFDLVPKPAETGKLPALGGIEAKLDSATPELFIDANFPDGATGTDLFIEAPGGAFVPVPKPLGPVQNGKQRFVVSFASPAEAAAIKSKPLTLTFVSDEGAREASVTVE